MMDLAMFRSSDGEGDALTFRYLDQQAEVARDITNAEFIIDDYSSITEMCKYDHMPQFFRGWIDLSNGDWSDF
jgi:hypothetical protein